MEILNIEYVDNTENKGFTLIELLIVIAIIGILAAIAIPMYKAQTVKARLSEVITAIGYVKSAAGTFYANNDRWPDCSISFTSIADTLDVQSPPAQNKCDDRSRKSICYFSNAKEYFCF